MSSEKTLTDDPRETTRSTDAPGARDAPPSTPALVVVLVGANPSVGTFVLPLRGVKQVEIGRASGEVREIKATASQEKVRLEIPDPKLSSRHLSVEVLSGGLRVRDLGSKNGTHLHGEAISQASRMGEREPLLAGSTLFVFSSAVAPPGPNAWPFPTTHPGLARDLQRLARLATAPLSVMLLGETGAGKEVVARAIHERSGRPGAFVAVNCGAIPRELIESQFFGHKRGSFSGAHQDHPGFFRAAHQGTLLLDEVGDMPLHSQPALLRALQFGEVTPVGASTPAKVSVRVIAATHQPLERLIAEGKFRADLYARLKGFVLNLPPLRDRKEDLGTLIASLLSGQEPGVQLASSVVLELYSHAYPFNVRELAQALHTATLLEENGVVKGPIFEQTFAEESPARPLDASEQQLREELLQRLQETGWNVSQVAREMGKARQQIQRWMRRFSLKEGP